MRLVSLKNLMRMHSKIKLVLKRILFNKVFSFISLTPKIRGKIFGLLTGRVVNLSIEDNCYFSKFNTEFGDGTFVNVGCKFYDNALVSIGDSVDIGMDCAFVTVGHDLGPAGHRAGKLTLDPIFVGNGVWIGARSIILSGVVVGEGVIIAAGSVVTRNCERNCLYAGVPAKFVKNLNL